MTNTSSNAESLASHCVSCGTELRGKFCQHCGEKVFDPHEHSFKHFLEELLHTVTHLDGKFLKSLARVLFKPGALTNEYLAGRKKLFTKPLTLFVIANVIYFFVQPLVNINTFNSTLRMQIAPNMAHGPFARAMVERKLERRQLELATYEKLYNAKSEHYAKSLIVLQIPLFALLVNLLYLRRRRHFFDHLVFSTHAFAFMLFLNILITFTLYFYFKLGGNVYNLEVPYLLLTWLYLGVAVRTVYRQSVAATLIKSVLVTGAFIATLFIYRFILFLLTFWTV